MSTDFKRLLAWMAIFMTLVVFTGTNTFLLMHESVDSFERKRQYYASNINIQVAEVDCLEEEDCEVAL